MRKVCLIFMMALELCVHYGNAQTMKTLSGKKMPVAEVDEFIKTQMDSFGLPGLSIAIIIDSKIIYYRTLGVTNIDTKEKVSEEALFDAGSMSKTPFT